MQSYPPEIDQIAADAGLGKVVDRYRPSVAIEMSFVVTLACLGLAGLLIGDDLGKIIGAVASGLALLISLPTWLQARRKLYLCSDGLLTTTGKSTVRTLFTWEDVAHIRVWTTRLYQSPPDDLGRCVLVLKDGTKLNLARPPYAGGDQLIASVEEQMVATSHPRRSAEITATGASTFGPITVTTEGVRDGDRFASWSDITGVERGRVRLRIWTGAGRPAISRQVRTIPDVTVLVDLVSDGAERYRRRKGDAHGSRPPDQHLLGPL
ncbi:DUF6585 family protein [Nonomuraea jiangxiensis]|uniref:Uncharacterized protein n=1 Tax=Nonomuraea jiangxiensis TaxID=633440 RepID=A0A1G9VPG6_9ACTN|nr:DUF6585 family protein [Nonomuraea jiangxiensis]SDM73973.1 hypothetical protein SAMN05421869_1543 [Nonomuraea jiangxiensis]